MIYDRIAAKAFERIFLIKDTVWYCVFTVMASWLDAIGFSDEEWMDVERVEWNCDRPLSFLPGEDFDFGIMYKSGVGSDEKMEESVEREFGLRRMWS